MRETTEERKENAHQSEMEISNACTMMERDKERERRFPPPNNVYLVLRWCSNSPEMFLFKRGFATPGQVSVLRVILWSKLTYNFFTSIDSLHQTEVIKTILDSCALIWRSYRRWNMRVSEKPKKKTSRLFCLYLRHFFARSVWGTCHSKELVTLNKIYPSRTFFFKSLTRLDLKMCP